MKRVTVVIFILVAALCAWLLVTNVTAPKRVVIRSEAPKAAVLDSGKSRPTDFYDDERERAAMLDATTAKIEAQADETIISVFSSNLDTDETEEQVIAVKKKSDPSGAISIVVADYDPARRKWERAWEAPTAATNTKLFTVKTCDAIGDHNVNIVCFGMNEASEQTMSLFWRTFERSDGALSYKDIFSIKADYVELREVPRSEGYQLGQINGVSWPVVAWVHDPKSDNPLDRVEARYDWNFAAGKYEKTGETKIPGNDIERIKLDALISKNGGNFETFLSGLWMKTQAGSIDTATPAILMFNPSQKKMTFHSDTSEEVYGYTAPQPRKYGLTMLAKNESIASMSRYVDVELAAVDSIILRVRDNVNLKIEASNDWSGTYLRMTEASGAQYEAKPSPERAPLPSLSGTYRSQTGLEMTFTKPRLVIVRDGASEEGGYAIYRVGDKIALDVKIFKDAGIVKESSVFSLEYAETRSGKTLRKTITLTPSKTGIKGLIPTNEATVVLEQS